MKDYGISNLRNVVLVGHQSSGKTTLAEAILFNAGVVSRIGSVEDGNTTLDSSPDEIERKISITAGLAFFEFSKNKITILDTPGYEDFVGDVLSCLPVVEGGVVVMSADGGVEVGTEKTWGYLDRYGLPRIVCVNRMDKEHANFDKCLADAQKFLSSKVMPLQLPIGQGTSFKGVVDILKKKALIYSDGKYSEEEIPADLAGKADEWRRKLMDFAAETDDALLEKFLEGGELTDEELTKGLAEGCIAGTLVPLVVTSATENIGIHQLVEFFISLLPSPEWRSEMEVKSVSSGETERIRTGSDAPTVSFVFKALSEKHIGDLSFIRVFSGKVNVGEELYNSGLGSSERIGQLYFIQGKNRVETSSI
ncbi:MAG: GTP-binding protein, partial [Candidatus Krumholzibacteria bacterium]|nr:GTP-binding protein [Candidatus Krumholzibacteria bacterium]